MVESLYEVFIKTVTAYYKLLTVTTRLHEKTHIEVGEGIKTLTDLTVSQLSLNIFELIPFIQNASMSESSSSSSRKSLAMAAAKKKKKVVTATGAVKGEIVREAKAIPTLIFTMEQYERFLIQVSRKRNNPELMENVKRSTARDFRIMLDAVNENFDHVNKPMKQ